MGKYIFGFLSIINLVVLGGLSISIREPKNHGLEYAIKQCQKNSDDINLSLKNIEIVISKITNKGINTNEVYKNNIVSKVSKSTLSEEDSTSNRQYDSTSSRENVMGRQEYLSALDGQLSSVDNYQQELRVHDEFEKIIEQQQLQGLSILSTRCGETLCELRVAEDKSGLLVDIDIAELDDVFANEILIVPSEDDGIQRMFVGLDKHALLNRSNNH